MVSCYLTAGWLSLGVDERCSTFGGLSATGCEDVADVLLPVTNQLIPILYILLFAILIPKSRMLSYTLSPVLALTSTTW